MFELKFPSTKFTLNDCNAFTICFHLIKSIKLQSFNCYLHVTCSLPSPYIRHVTFQPFAKVTLLRNSQLTKITKRPD